MLYHTSVFTAILLVTKTLLPVIDSNCQYSKSQKLETLAPSRAAPFSLSHCIRNACCITLCSSLLALPLSLHQCAYKRPRERPSAAFRKKGIRSRGEKYASQSSANMKGLPCRVHLSSALIFSCLTMCSSSSPSSTSTTSRTPEASSFPAEREKWFNNGTSRSPVHLSASTFFRRGGGINVDDHASRGRERLRWHKKNKGEGAAPTTSTTAGPDDQNEERR